MTVVLWFGGEIFGIFLGLSMSGDDSGAYFWGLVVAAVGAGIAYAIANSVKVVATSDMAPTVLDKS